VKRRSLLAAVGALVLGGSVARADIQVTFTRMQGAGENAGFDLIRFFAAFAPTSFLGTPDDPTTPQREGWGATGLQAVGAIMRVADGSPPDMSLKFRFTDENGDGFDDADTDSSTVSVRTNLASNQTLGTHFRIGPTGPGAWTPVLVEPAGDMSRTDPVSGELVGPAPRTTYAGLKQWRVEGANPNAPDLAARTALAGVPGAGALFAVAVLPTGGRACVEGQIAANAGPIERIETGFLCIPDPGGLGIIGLGAVALTRRRSTPSMTAQSTL